MPDVRRLLQPFSNLFPQKKLIDLSSRKIFLPFYHTISDVEIPHIKHLYTVRDTMVFREDLEYLCRHFTPVSLKELQQHVLEKRQPQQPIFHLTFDDGLSEVYHVIAPVLQEMGIPATIFLNSAFIDNKGLFYRYKVSLLIDKIENSAAFEKSFKNIKYTDSQKVIDDLKKAQYQDVVHLDELAKELEVDFNAYLKERQPYLLSDQIQELINKGFSVGAHSVDHPMFSQICLQEQKRQVRDSLEELKQFGVEDNYFSFPFNDDGVTKDLFKWLYEEGGCALSFGVSGLKDDLFSQHLHRFPMEGNDTDAKKLVKSEYFYFLLKQAIGKNRIRRK